MSQARELTSNLPGGELVIEEQEEVMQMLEQLRDRKKCRGFSVSCLSPLTYPAEISWHGFLNGLLHPLRNQPRAYKWRSTRRPPLQWPTRVTRLSIPIFSSSSTEANFEAGRRSAFLARSSPCVALPSEGPSRCFHRGSGPWDGVPDWRHSKRPMDV